MDHAEPLVATLVVGLALACTLGFAARLLRLTPVIGYVAAGIAVGPHTPGFVADPGVTAGLAEIALGMADFAMKRLGVPAADATVTIEELRSRQ
ncbi:hypothetical protein GXW78_05990 [Roseomonas terrae]|jgi:CPA2 family monovalent cation:H+ antiporter-2|uniref:Cation/H+ exchanger domain-containing protein n=1 Tax=Neoroseomonas terrae TaxID=424799 RepID=A0ABS5EE11_9PROT|nr:cation:proton antiporter [Neoroseomonas terrae]MBR0649205.1 hypothetical protein [Neoroseomonas terrae]